MPEGQLCDRQTCGQVENDSSGPAPVFSILALLYCQGLRGSSILSSTIAFYTLCLVLSGHHELFTIIVSFMHREEVMLGNLL